MLSYRQWGPELGMLNNFKVGCDPEFMLLDGAGHSVAASRYFPQAGPIGYDHNGRVAEFRPEPTKGIYPIVKKIQTLIYDQRLSDLGHKLRAGAICNHDCLGGHIHFGFDCFAVKPMTGMSILNGGGQFNAKGAAVTKALDALTKTLERLDILPAHECNARRTSAQGQGAYYGAYGDVRDCNGHMEYRTMASWLFDPKVAFLCLTAAKLAAVDPEGTHAALAKCEDWPTFKGWLERYRKDLNARRASEKLLARGLAHLQVDPAMDFRGRWKGLGI